MPKETFFNLPSEKQERLMEAAQKEFSRVPLQDASIAKIVKLAGISRGSFYQYFEDKDDLYYYYFDTLRLSSKSDFESLLKQSNGNLFEAAVVYFNRWFEEALYGPNSAFYKNLFMYLDFKGTARVSPEISQEAHYAKLKEQRKSEHKEKIETMMDIIDTSQLRFSNDKELIMLVKLVTGMMFTSINHAYKQEIRGEKVNVGEIKEEFATKLGWLQHGVYKNEVGEDEC